MSACEAGEIWKSSVDCTNANFLVVITALKSYKLWSVGQLGEGHMRALCIFPSNCMWIYNYFKIIFYKREFTGIKKFKVLSYMTMSSFPFLQGNLAWLGLDPYVQIHFPLRLEQGRHGSTVSKAILIYDSFQLKLSLLLRVGFTY